MSFKTPNITNKATHLSNNDALHATIDMPNYSCQGAVNSITSVVQYDVKSSNML